MSVQTYHQGTLSGLPQPMPPQSSREEHRLSVPRGNLLTPVSRTLLSRNARSNRRRSATAAPRVAAPV
jgi:hypothetical protein